MPYFKTSTDTVEFCDDHLLLAANLIAARELAVQNAELALESLGDDADPEARAKAEVAYKEAQVLLRAASPAARALRDRLPSLVEITEQEARDLTAPSKEQMEQQAAAEKKAALRELDLQSVRALREYVAALHDAPQELKDIEAAAIKLRGNGSGQIKP